MIFNLAFGRVSPPFTPFNIYMVFIRLLVKKRHILAAFLDISKAFDSAWWPGIFDILVNSECPPNLLAAVRSFFNDRRVSLKFGDVSASKYISLGCPQGSIISPLLWNIFFNSVFDIPHHRFISVIAYADDLSIISKHHSESLSAGVLSDFLTKLHSWSQLKKISFSPIKSVVMVLRGSSAWAPSLFFDQTCLPVVIEFKFLGILITKNFHFQNHLRYILRKGEARALMLFRLLKSNKALTFSNMKLIYKSVIIPSVSYGVSFWFKTACTLCFSKKIISLQRKCLIAISGCLRTSSSNAVDVIVGVMPIMTYLNTLQAREALRVSGSSQFDNFNFTRAGGSIQVTGPDNFLLNLSHTEFVNFLRDRAFDRWGSDWIASSTGRFTFQFFTSIRLRLSRFWICPRGPLARFLSGHSLCDDYFSRFFIKHGTLCRCSPPGGSLLHDLFQCDRFRDVGGAFDGCDPEALTSRPLYDRFLHFVRIREATVRSSNTC